MRVTDGRRRLSASPSKAGSGPARRRPSKNWKWVGVLALGPLCVAATFVLASRVTPPNYDLRPPVPPGYRAVANPYYAFSIPKSWKENSAKSDQNGDLFYQGGSGSAAEHTAIRKTRPATTEPLPAIIALYFRPHYRLARRRAAHIPHATFAQVDILQAANGRTATLYHGWVAGTETEFWVLFTGPTSTVSEMAATLIA